MRDALTAGSSVSSPQQSSPLPTDLRAQGEVKESGLAGVPTHSESTGSLRRKPGLIRAGGFPGGPMKGRRVTASEDVGKE